MLEPYRRSAGGLQHPAAPPPDPHLPPERGGMRVAPLHTPASRPSTSGAGHARAPEAGAGVPRAVGPARRRGPAPPRVTNQGKEMRVAKLLEEAGLTDDSVIVLDPDNPVPNPELGPLERRVSTTFEDGLVQEEVDLEAMAYWFTEPPEGWSNEKRRLKKAPVVATDEADEVRHADVEGRRPLTDFKEGDILTGTVVKQMLHHGIQVDVGAAVDGLICVSELEAWRALGAAAPELGEAVECVVAAVRHDPIFRFPLQLMPAAPALARRVPPAATHLPPLDLREVSLAQLPDVAARSGREWAAIRVHVPQRDPLETDEVVGAWELSEEELARIDDAVAGVEW